MSEPQVELQRPDKIILAMYDLSSGTSKPLKYEDIVVKAFHLYPRDFALRGYEQYPDSSDIHKPLYGPLKRAGLVLTGNKQFRLTAKGLERGKSLSNFSGVKVRGNGQRLSRDKEAELNRLYQTEAFKLFLSGQPDSILDSDLFAYLGVTVRTERNEFLGRLNTVTEALQSAVKLGDRAATRALELHNYLLRKFSETIQKMRERK